jgi:hypothetical protein
VIWLIELLAALLVATVTALSTFFLLKAEDFDTDPGMVRVGAFVQGAVLGAMLAFVILPFRMQMMENPGAPPRPEAAFAFLGAFAVLLMARFGLLVRVPIIGGPVRAYRRASLRRQIRIANARLERLQAMAPPAP